MKQKTQWTTSVSGFGWQGHAAVLAPRDDPGGCQPTVAIMLPEAGGDELRGAIAYARTQQGRVLLVADTRQQVRHALSRMLMALPDHRRVALERAHMLSRRLS